jgi:hypothetical protein
MLPFKSSKFVGEKEEHWGAHIKTLNPTLQDQNEGSKNERTKKRGI